MSAVYAQRAISAIEGNDVNQQIERRPGPSAPGGVAPSSMSLARFYYFGQIGIDAKSNFYNQPGVLQ
jgi:hypothetical protein